MNAKFVRLFFVALILCSFSFTANAQENPFAQLKEKFEQGNIFHADFHHQSIDSYTKDTVASKGIIWVGKTRYKVRADHQSVVVNGKTSMVYDDNRNRVIISKYDPSEDDFAPSRILNGIDSTFTVATQKKQGDQFYIKLTSDDPFAIYKQVEIFTTTDLIPLKIRAIDPVDNIITTTFTGGKYIKPQKNMFLLNYPDGAKIVDLRKQSE
ncbi:MAG TPA: outer membrane lipoprotein carrier protein LolA [Balneolaceae bacterium]|nr:outer membrane lipoprotein carrier protein LolA [Balneolaceae bacterium]